MNKENTKVAVDYLYTFYLDLKQLNNQYASYFNYIKELQFLLNGNDLTVQEISIDGIDDQYKEALMKKVQEARYYITQINLQFSIIATKLKLNTKEIIELEGLYESLNSTFIYRLNDFFNYTKKINEIIFESVIEELLTSQNDILKEMYN